MSAQVIDRSPSAARDHADWLGRWRPWLASLAVLGSLLVVAASWAISYDALLTLAAAANISEDRRWLYPVTIDGVTVVALIAALVLQDASRLTRRYV